MLERFFDRSPRFGQLCTWIDQSRRVDEWFRPHAAPTPTLRGRWIGTLIIAPDGAVSVELKRRIASYGVLTLTSGEDGWGWSFHRLQKWYTEDGVESERGIPTLSEAIEAGLVGAMRLVRPACSMRDTRRRAAMDEEYAERHPIRHPKPNRRGASEFVRQHGQPSSPPTKATKKDCACKTTEAQRNAPTRSAVSDRSASERRSPVTGGETKSPKNGEEALLDLFVHGLQNMQQGQVL